MVHALADRYMYSIFTFFTAINTSIAPIAMADVVVNMINTHTMILTWRMSQVINYTFILSYITLKIMLYIATNNTTHQS